MASSFSLMLLSGEAVLPLDQFKSSLVDDYFNNNILNPEVGIALLNSFLDDEDYHLVKSMIERGVSLTEEVIERCISSCDLGLYKLLWPKHLELTIDLMNTVCSNGNLELAKWLRANGCPWDRWSCAFAAGNGRLEVLKW